MEIIKGLIYVLSSILMLGIIIVNPDICDITSVFYCSILTTFLGIDVVGMIKKTCELPRGEYKDIKTNRYILCIICYSVLICASYIMHKIRGYEYNGMLTSFTSAIFLITTILLGGLEGNKIATDIDGGSDG